jgi:hypothetical protein
MMDSSVPLVYGGGAFVNGPELRDPRLNLEYTLFVKNKIDGEKFWVKYISGDNPMLEEVRWDLFEDTMLAYLQKSLMFNGEELSKINYHVFFGILFDQLSRREDEKAINPTYPLPTSMVNSPESHLRYKGNKVRKGDWVSFIQNVGFKEYAKRCVTEENIAGGAAEAKFLEKLNQMKTAKRGTVVYEDGTIYDGGREAGRPHGRGSLVWPDK